MAPILLDISPCESITNRSQLHHCLRAYSLPIFELQVEGDAKSGLEVMGSACVLDIAHDTFIISAAHVLQRASHTDLFYPVSNRRAVKMMGPISVADGAGVDIGICYLEGPPPWSRTKHLKTKYFHHGLPSQNQICIACGYPASKNRARYGVSKFSDNIYSIEFISRYIHNHSDGRFGPLWNILMDLGLPNRPKGKNLPKLKGMSGGPIWSIANRIPQIIGVLQYHDDDKIKREQSVYGTNIRIALNLIAKDRPDLRKYIPDWSFPIHPDYWE